ncbi:MAG: glutamyl-tRNA reductase [Halobacteriaceae archaeon]
MNAAGVIRGVRVSHDVASLSAIEAARAPDQQTAVRRLLAEPDVEEAYALQTCHRVEAYVVAPAAEPADRALATHYGGAGVTMDHDESLRHLLSVAAGLESVVLGEDQILGQVRTAREDARAAGGVGSVLADAVEKAIHVGERARTETAINEGVVSMGSAAVRLAKRERPVGGRPALVVGAGEMGRLAAEALANADAAPLTVANRTLERAERVAADLDGDADAIPLADADDALSSADVVVTATGSEDPLFDRDSLADAGETLVVDLGQPRDVAPTATGLDDVAVFDVDDIESVTTATREAREAAAGEVREMIDRELDRLRTQFKRKRADEVIGGMYESAERVKEREVATALNRLDADGDLTPDQREVVEALADSLVSQLLAAPTKSLRDAAAEDDWETINTAIQLFDPDFGDEADLPDAVPDAVAADDD